MNVAIDGKVLRSFNCQRESKWWWLITSNWNIWQVIGITSVLMLPMTKPPTHTKMKNWRWSDVHQASDYYQIRAVRLINQWQASKMTTWPTISTNQTFSQWPTNDPSSRSKALNDDFGFAIRNLVQILWLVCSFVNWCD